MLRLVGTIISVTFDDDCDFTGDLERFMADDDILESDLRWPKVRWGLGLELRCCDQAATWMKESSLTAGGPTGPKDATTRFLCFAVQWDGYVA